MIFLKCESKIIHFEYVPLLRFLCDSVLALVMIFFLVMIYTSSIEKQFTANVTFVILLSMMNLFYVD